METALSAYTDGHIIRYFNDVKENGLTEHGFPRLTSNIGILIAHGRRRDLLPIFLEMMEFCCKNIPRVRAANDFSVREIICCLWELEKNNTVPDAEIERWKAYLATIEPTSCYNRFATAPTDQVRNWALFTGVSEYFRYIAGIGGSMDFIDMQIASQLQWLDENGMYMDNDLSDIHQPIVYDLVPRVLFTLLLHFGYRGRYYERIDACLKETALMTLKMQSPNGEIAFGGRSNQFIHNECDLAVIYEYEANRYAREGNTELAERFRSAVERALNVTERWLEKKPIRHIKNRFPTETKYGCESYAYFDKYMITVASMLYPAYLICDGSAPTVKKIDHTPEVFISSRYFHKLFLKSGGYGLEFDLNADPNYDANGLGRIHREGAPSAICLSCPCPEEPKYTVDIAEPMAFSMCSAIRIDNKWSFGAEKNAIYEVLESRTDKNSASATLLCSIADDHRIKENYTVNKNGVAITIEGDGEIGYTIPAFCFDGEIAPEIVAEDHSLTVFYEGWICRYTTNGTVLDLKRTAANRNGHYKVFLATSENVLEIKVEISEQ